MVASRRTRPLSMRPPESPRTSLTSLLALVALACGGSDGTGVELAPVATNIAVHDGNNQSASPGTLLATAPSVKVTDTNGNPVSGVAVTFVVASGGGSITGANQTSNGLGIAAVGSWTLGPAAGTNTLTAIATGLTGSPVTFSATAEAVPSNALTAIHTGHAHTCGLTASGAAYCWGLNENGQLGNGTLVNSTTPVSVSGGLSFSVLALGVYHTCGLTGSGAAYCWGGNDYGQLGTGSNTPSLTPVPVSGDLSFRTLVAGEHNCGLTTAGAAFCWGRNEDGQLGNGSFNNSRIPAAVSGGLTFSALATGIYHTCGLTAGGAAYCWGWNANGQLGNGYFGLDETRSTPVAVVGGLTFSALAAGFGWHSCALTNTGAAYCWGNNLDGQVGNGFDGDWAIVAPVAVSGSYSFSVVVTGAFHTCGLTTIETDYCWGDDHWGELGDSSGTCETCESSTPVAVYGAFRFRTLSGGGGHTCGIARDGPAYCWGLNEYGQLGNGTTVNQSAPVGVVWQEETVAAATKVGLGDRLGTAPACGLQIRQWECGAVRRRN
jgi:alpha-tubulin suppressor-like RCC1 family protein